MILPGIRVKKQNIDAAKSLVGKDVAKNSLAAGIPAKFIRLRQSDGRNGPVLEHIWLNHADDF